jgi:MSHA pilin protein MshD
MSTESRRRSRGLSLIELVVFIVVIAIGIGGIVASYGQYTKTSVDPIVRKQALAVAESLLEEVALQPFTYCDPSDPAVHTATSATPAQCPMLLEAVGPEPGQTRTGANPFNNVNDYHGSAMTGAAMTDITGAAVPSLAAYNASVSVSASTGELPNLLSNSDALRIVVTVSGPAGVSVALQGYRLRYAPNQP